jgi:AcrR family transcriptional regulator
MARTSAREQRRDDRRDVGRDERRQQLLDAAVEAIRSVGPAATMEQLARQGGVTKPILYRHFGDRDGLINAIADGFSTELIGAIAASLVGSDQPRELLHSTVDTYLAFIERDPSLYRFLVQQASSSGGALQINPVIEAVSKQVAVVIGDQLRAAGADSGPAVPWAFGIVGLVHQAGDWWLDERTMTRETLTGYLTTLLWSGLDGTATASRATDPT